MTIASVLWLYGEIAILLAVSQVAWKAFRPFLTGARPASDLRRLLRVLLVATLLLPLVTGILPKPWWGMEGAAPGQGSPLLRVSPALPAAEQGVSGAGFTWAETARWEAWHTEVLVTAILSCLLAGFAIQGLLYWRQIRGLRQVVRDAVPIHRIGRVRVAVSDRTQVSFSTVVLARADVIVPIGMLERRRELNIVLRHELQHHRTADPLWSALADTIRLLFFWHPAAHAWARELTTVAEMGCDEAIVRRGVPLRPYLDCLVRVAEMVLDTRASLIASSAMAPARGRGSSSTQLQRRIDMLTRTRSSHSPCRLALAAVILMAASTLAAGYGAALARPNLPDPAASPATAAPEERVVTLTTPTRAGEVTVVAAAGDCPEGAVVISADDCEDLLEESGVDCMVPSALEHGSGSAWRRGGEIELKTRDGDPILLSDLRGRVVLIDYWASWCRPCWGDADTMKELHRDFGSAGLDIVGVSLDGDAAGFEAFIEANDLPWPQRLADGAWKDPAVSSFEVQAIPTHILIDRAGNWTRLPLLGPEALRASVKSLVEGGGNAPLPAY